MGGGLEGGVYLHEHLMGEAHKTDVPIERQVVKQHLLPLAGPVHLEQDLPPAPQYYLWFLKREHLLTQRQATRQLIVHHVSARISLRRANECSAAFIVTQRRYGIGFKV